MAFKTREKASMSTQPPDNTSATTTPATASEPSPVLHSADALTASSAAAAPSPLHTSSHSTSSPSPQLSPWQRLSERRIAFFARREGMFLWLLGVPMLLAAIYMLLHYLSW